MSNKISTTKLKIILFIRALITSPVVLSFSGLVTTAVEILTIFDRNTFIIVQHVVNFLFATIFRIKEISADILHLPSDS